jgi:hypothetical protein
MHNIKPPVIKVVAMHQIKAVVPQILRAWLSVKNPQLLHCVPSVLLVLLTLELLLMLLLTTLMLIGWVGGGGGGWIWLLNTGAMIVELEWGSFEELNLRPHWLQNWELSSCWFPQSGQYGIYLWLTVVLFIYPNHENEAVDHHGCFIIKALLLWSCCDEWGFGRVSV